MGILNAAGMKTHRKLKSAVRSTGPSCASRLYLSGLGSGALIHLRHTTHPIVSTSANGYQAGKGARQWGRYKRVNVNIAPCLNTI